MKDNFFLIIIVNIKLLLSYYFFSSLYVLASLLFLFSMTMQNVLNKCYSYVTETVGFFENKEYIYVN